MRERLTHEQWLLRELKRGRRLTPLTALIEAGCLRLGARVYDLRRAGHEITTKLVVNNQGGRHAEYRLVRKKRIAQAPASVCESAQVADLANTWNQGSQV